MNSQNGLDYVKTLIRRGESVLKQIESSAREPNREYQLSNFEVGQSLEHGLNILIKIISKGDFKTPGGYAQYCSTQRRAG